MCTIRLERIRYVSGDCHRPARRFVLLPNHQSSIPAPDDRIRVVNLVTSHHLIDSIGDRDAALSGIQHSVPDKENAVCPVIGDQAAAGTAVPSGL